MDDGILFIVSAPSGAGKTSLLKTLLARDPALSLSVSCTTRQARAGERNGVHYHFLDRDQFHNEIAQNAFLEHAEVFGNFYGTREADVRAHLESGRDVVLEIDWQGARQVGERFSDSVGIFILPPSIAELEQRLLGRATDSESVIAQRMTQARNEMTHYGEYDYLVVNDRFETALDALSAIVMAERQRLGRQRLRLAHLLNQLD